MAEITATRHHADIASSSTASGSASASTPDVHYDIFVSHYEDETRGFAIALCSRLILRGLNVFLDELDFRDEDQTRMKYAISLASLQIVIFSPNYAHWQWCMDTLIQMTKSEAPILPVFYRVEPSHLRYTGKDSKGPYAQSLRDHEEKRRHDSETIQAWRDALYQVSNLSGIVLKESNRGEEELEVSNRDKEVLLDNVVDSVFKTCPPRDYHVFLSHRGPDTKKEFAKPLYERLVSRGLRVFLDKPELVPGLKIETQIEVPIQCASVNIVIFSPRFPESSWCMDEVFLMTKATGTILPVFYEVKPSDLDEVYIDTLLSHRKKQRHSTETIERWMGALASVPKSDDFMLAKNAGEELKEELMDKIVERVLKYIPKPQEVMKSSEAQRAVKIALNDDSKRSEVVPVEDVYIGLPEKLKDFEKAVLSQQEEKRVEAKVVGIVGGVGIGKTALAKEFFKCNRSNYSESSSLFNVRKYTDLRYLQSKIIQDLKHGPRNRIESVEQGKEILKQHRRSCQALVILDDVDHVDQLDALLPIKCALRPDSLILVTSRDKDVLNRSGIADSSLHHLAGLNREDSQKLLLSYAFNLPNLRHPSIYDLLALNIQHFQRFVLSYDYNRPFPRHPSDYLVFESLVEKFVMACDGLPLPLKVLGELLRGKDRYGWEKELNRLHNCELPMEIEHKLKMCYASLNEEEQQIFLDVACFIGEDRDRATRIFGVEGLQNLENRGLLQVTSKIEMNELLRNYGRNKAINSLTPRRLWQQETKQINDLLEKSSSELAQFRGITMNQDPRDEIEMPCCKQSGAKFSGTSNLKFLAAEGGYVENILTRVGSPDLLWLNWYKCTHSSLPSWISMKELRVLEVDGSKLTKLWQQPPLQLRELNIFAPLSEFPKSIGQLEHLEKIVVKYSGPLPFKTLPKEFGSLLSLKHLELIECSRMMSLPNSFRDLKNLQYLNLKGASSLRKLPDSFGKLTLLKYLSLKGCSEIRKLPGLERFTSLETLDVKGCKNLESIPELGQLKKLQILDVSGCSQIQTLLGLEHLNSLETFNVRGCRKLQSISGLGLLTKLSTLDVSRCSEIVSLPDLQNLTSLKSLNVSRCQKLQSIPGLGKLTKLQRLDVSGCSEIQTLPDLEHLTSLETFNVRGCEKLQSIDVSGCTEMQTLSGLEHLTSLEELNVSGCEKLRSIPELGQLTKLQLLNVSKCRKIYELPSVGRLTSLETLDVSYCWLLRRIAGLGQLRKLQTLDVSGCSELQQLSGLEHLTSLKMLNVSECEKLQSIAGLRKLTKLQKLDVSGCSMLRKLKGLKHLTYLKTLNVRRCHRIPPELPGVEHLTSLERWTFQWIDLQRMPWLERLTNLQELYFYFCDQLQSLSGLEHLTCLKTLVIYGGEKLQSIRGLDSLKKLRELVLSQMDQLRELPSLQNLTSLEKLSVCKLPWIRSIQGLGQLKKLQTLDFSYMETLPSLEHLTSLRSLNICSCWHLQKIEGLGLLTELLTLSVKKCHEIQTLSGLEGLISLKALDVGGCRKLESMPGLEHVTNLETLRVMECHEIQTLSGLEGLISLKALDVSGCKKLESMPRLEHVTNLERLSVKKCPEIQTLPVLQNLVCLNVLEVKKCEKLQRIPELGRLTEFHVLRVIKCKKLQSIPALGHLTKLQMLDVHQCPEIEELPGVEYAMSLEWLQVYGCPNVQWGEGVLEQLRQRLNDCVYVEKYIGGHPLPLPLPFWMIVEKYIGGHRLPFGMSSDSD